MPLSLDPVTTVAQEFAAQVDAENVSAKLPAAADQIAQDWASSGSIGEQRDVGGTGNSNLDRLASMNVAPPVSPTAPVDYGNSNLQRLAAMPTDTTGSSTPDETITATPSIHQMATQTIPAPSFLGGSVANLPGYAQDYGQEPHTLGGQAFAAGLPMSEQPTLVSALQSLPGLSDEQKRGLVQASSYIRDRLAKGQKFGDVLTDILGTPHMDTLQAAAALSNEPFRIGTEALKAIPTGGGTSLGQRIENAPTPVRMPAEFALGAAPYVGALAAAGATGGTSLAGLGGLVGTGINASVALQVGATADSYQRGEITQKQAAVQLAPLIGGYAAGPILRTIAKGAAAAGVSAGEWLKTPAGQSALRFAASERGGGPGEITPPSPDAAYDAALADARAATRTFREAQQAYRARTIGDPEYLAAREAFKVSQETFDKAETDFINAKNTAPPEMPKTGTAPASTGIPESGIPEAAPAETEAAAPAERNAGAPPPSKPTPAGGEPPPPTGGPPTTTTGGPTDGEVLPPANTKFITLMQQAVITPSERARILSEGRSRQAGGIAGVARGAGPFEQRLAQAGGAAKGQILPDFAAIGEKFTPDEMTQLSGQIDQALTNHEISSFQWKNAGDAFQRIMLGGREPQPAERKLLAQIFGPEFEQAIPKGPQQFSLWREILGTLGIPQTFSTSFDLSAFFRQAAVLGASHPAQWAKSFVPMVKAFVSEAGKPGIGRFRVNVGDGAQQLMERIDSNPWVKGTGELDGYGFRDVGGHLSTIDPLAEAGQREGQFASLNRSFVSKWTQYFPGIRASERAFVVMLNKLRSDVYASEAQRLWNSGVRDTGQYQGMAKTINHATGFGDFKAGEIVQGVNAFFSPRNLVARFQVVLDPITQPGSLLKPSARQLAAKNLVAFTAYNMAILGLVKSTGLANVELDPRSTDFGKARVGNTRFDFMGGFGPMIRLVARLSPEAVGGGVTKTATGKFLPIDRQQLAIDFLRGKLGPVPSFITDAFAGKNMVGQATDLTSPAGIRTQLYNRFVPFVVQDVTDALQQQGAGAAAVAAPASALGVGVTSYANPSRSKLEAQDAYFQRTIDPKTNQPYKDFADASKALGANAASAQAANDPDVQKAQAALDQNPSPVKDAEALNVLDYADNDAKLEAGKITVRQWHDQKTIIDANRARGIVDALKASGATDYKSGDPVMDNYYAIFKQFASASGIVLDKQGLSQALDAYTAQLSPQDQARIDANTGLKGTPTEQAYRGAVKQLGDAGFFNQEKLGYASPYWQKLFAAAKTPLAKNGLMPDRFRSLGAMKAAYVQAYQNANPKTDPQIAAADAARQFERIGAVKQFRTQLNQHLQNFYKSNPALLRLATQWGFNTLSKAEEKVLAGAGATQ